MRHISKSICTATLVILANICLTNSLLAQRQYRETESNLRSLLQRIQTHTDVFKRSIDDAFNRTQRDRNLREDEINRTIADFESATDRLKTRFENRQSTAADVRLVLDSAARINNSLVDNRLESRMDQNWRPLQADLDQLARAYYIDDWRWETSRPGTSGPVIREGGGRQAGERGGRQAELMTGTYRLSSSLGDDPRRAAENATRNLPASQRQRVYDSLLRRLEPPDILAIQRDGREVTIASSRAPQITFVADGSEHTETTPSGRTIRVRATLSRDQLAIERTGERAQDFTVTFNLLDAGRRMLVTRRMYSEQFDQPISVQSYYEKTSDVAKLDLYAGTSDSDTARNTGGDFAVRDGTELVAVLNSDLSTNTSRNNDRFTMTVRSPAEYEGATLEGYVTNVNRSGRISGRSELTLNFDKIRLRNGETHRFAGIMESVNASGQSVRVDNEGVVREEQSQTNRTATRAGVGTALGAIIGAIAGGGKGAAIGAVVGAGAGAGSVYVEGRDDLELRSGTELTIRATGPR